MTETETAVTVETIDDAKVEEFFNNEGKFNEEQPEVVETPVKESVNEQVTQPEDERPREEKKVNLGALHEERNRRKEEQAARKAVEERAADLERRLAAYEKRPEAEDDDPVESLKRENEQIINVLNAQAQHAIKQKADKQYWDKVTESEKAFKQDVPDFDDAVKFLADTRREELTELGWDANSVAKIIADETRWIADKAYQDEVNPAERFFNLAVRRGYKKAQTKEDPVLAKLNNIEKGIKANKQLPPGAKSVKQDLTIEALADMPMDVMGNPDFDSAWKKLGLG